MKFKKGKNWKKNWVSKVVLLQDSKKVVRLNNLFLFYFSVKKYLIIVLSNSENSYIFAEKCAFTKTLIMKTKDEVFEERYLNL